MPGRSLRLAPDGTSGSKVEPTPSSTGKAVHFRTQTWKIGDLARLTGPTVRTLHHYDQIGLLHASERTESLHRMYSEADLERLQRLDEQLRLQQQLRRRLGAVRTRLESGEYVHSSQFFEIMGAIHMLEKDLTPTR